MSIELKKELNAWLLPINKVFSNIFNCNTFVFERLIKERKGALY